MIAAEPRGPALKARLFRGFSDPSRLSILECLRSGPLTVGEVVAATGRAQSSVSTHLASLHESGLVSREQRGRFVYYSISDRRVDEILRLGDVLLAGAAATLSPCSHFDQTEPRGPFRPRQGSPVP